MAGKFRRKFVDIISDTVTEHYRGKVTEQKLQAVLEDIRKQISKLEQDRKKVSALRAESLRKLKKLPLEKLNELLVDDGNTSIE